MGGNFILVWLLLYLVASHHACMFLLFACLLAFGLYWCCFFPCLIGDYDGFRVGPSLIWGLHLHMQANVDGV